MKPTLLLWAILCHSCLLFAQDPRTVTNNNELNNSGPFNHSVFYPLSNGNLYLKKANKQLQAGKIILGAAATSFIVYFLTSFEGVHGTLSTSGPLSKKSKEGETIALVTGGVAAVGTAFIISGAIKKHKGNMILKEESLQAGTSQHSPMIGIGVRFNL